MTTKRRVLPFLILTCISGILAQGGNLKPDDISAETCEMLCGNQDKCSTKTKNDCRFYNECYKLDGVWRGHVKKCPFGLHYDEILGVCNYVKDVNCPDDRCRSTTVLTSYSNASPYFSSKCDGAYWECKNNISEAHCCPEKQIFANGKCVDGGCVNDCQEADKVKCSREGAGHQFQKIHSHCGEYRVCQENTPGEAAKRCCEVGYAFVYEQGCIKNESCTDPCGNISRAAACNIAKIDKTTYRYINNNRTVKCRPGTMVGSDGESCFVCVQDPSIVGSRCKEEVFINFNRTNMSPWNMDNWGAQPSWVGIEKSYTLEIKNEKMKIPDHRSDHQYILVPSYASNAIEEIYIELIFRPHNKHNNSMTLVSNCETTIQSSPSLNVRLLPTDTLEVTAVAKDDNANIRNVSLRVSYKMNEFNHLMLQYNGAQLEVSNKPANGQEYKDSTPLSGYLIKSIAGMYIGACTDKKTQFFGELDEIHIWTCNPYREQNNNVNPVQPGPSNPIELNPSNPVEPNPANPVEPNPANPVEPNPANPNNPDLAVDPVVV